MNISTERLLIVIKFVLSVLTLGIHLVFNVHFLLVIFVVYEITKTRMGVNNKLTMVQKSQIMVNPYDLSYLITAFAMIGPLVVSYDQYQLSGFSEPYYALLLTPILVSSYLITEILKGKEGKKKEGESTYDHD